MVAQLRTTGTEVKIDPQSYPNGRFARLQTLREIPSNCGNLHNSALHIRCSPMQDSWRTTGYSEVTEHGW